MNGGQGDHAFLVHYPPGTRSATQGLGRFSAMSKMMIKCRRVLPVATIAIPDREE